MMCEFSMDCTDEPVQFGLFMYAVSLIFALKTPLDEKTEVSHYRVNL